MREKINLLARGQIEYELPRLMLHPEQLLLSVEAGKRLHTTVNLKNSEGRFLKGFVSSDNQAVEVVGKNISGTDINVELKLDAEHLDAGDVLEGELVFVTNCGEIWLPYRAEIKEPTLATAEGSLADMKQFTGFARTHFIEAAHLFTDPEFVSFLGYHEPESRNLYEHFRKSAEPERALEEFLVATGRKLPVLLETDRTELEFTVGDTELTESFSLYKDNWGYTKARITSDRPFVKLVRDNVDMEQFNGHTAEVAVRIRPEYMVNGNNTAVILVESGNRQIRITVTCRRESRNEERLKVNHDIKSLMLKTTECYLAFRMNRLPESRYIAEMEALLSKVEQYLPEDAPETRLAYVKLMRLGGQESQANAMLRSVTESDLNGSSIMTRATWLYLKAERAGSTRAEFMEQLYRIANEHHELPGPALFLMRLDERYQKNPKLKLDELRGIFDNGCSSPVIFLEAMQLLNENPALLHEIGEFELQTIAFGTRRKLISRELALQFSYRAERTKEYRMLYYIILSGLYERFGLTETLTAICKLLIREGLKEKYCAFWYRRGVEEQLRVSELYEYYMMTAEPDLESPLDPDILMYFAYNSKLSDRRLAYLYANIVIHKESDPGTFETFAERIRLYAMDRIREGKNSRYLSILYRECLDSPETETETLAYLPRVCFRHEISCANPEMRYVCVNHPELSEEVVTPLINGQAQVDIFTDDVILSFEDDYHNRYIGGIEYEDRKLLSAEDRYQEAFRKSPESTRMLLYLTRKAEQEGRMDQATAQLKRSAVKLSELGAAYRSELVCSLVLYYYDNFEDEMLEDYLLELELDRIPKKHRGKLINLMILRGQTERAIVSLAAYGFDSVEGRLFDRIAATISMDQKAAYRTQLLSIFNYAYSIGRRNERMLSFLADYFQGSTIATYQLWQDLRAAGLAAEELSERVLSQILFTETYLNLADEVFKAYEKPGCSRQVVRAYLTYVSYKYLINDVPIGAFTMEFLKRDVRNDENDICTLALLRYLSEQEDLTEDDRNAAEYWLLRMEAKGKLMPCFLKLGKYFRLPDGLRDKCLIEYRTDPRHKVTLHYSYRVNGRRKQKDMPMRNICYGIFIKDIVLFLGEKIEYVISDESETDTFVSERMTLEKNDDSLDPGTQFGQINAIIKAREDGDKDRAIALLNEYLKNRFATEQLFHEISGED